ncbi:MAG: sulfurtransferase TusA family protein [Nitrospinota bacterium]
MGNEENRPNQVLDIKGQVCPYTFVRSKLKLEEMETGDVLKIIIDHPPAVKNVPDSITSDGHKILKVNEVGTSEWEIFVEKG